MKRINALKVAVAVAILGVAGAAIADTLISTTPNPGGGYTQVWVNGSGQMYTKSCNAAGSCVINDHRAEP